jgi:hypothetical protein
MNNFGKNLNVKRRAGEFVEKELFCELVDMYEELALRSEKIHSEHGFDLSSYDEDFFLTIENLFFLKYGDWKTQIITWYVWERKDLETGEVGTLEWTNEDTEETKEVIIKCSEDLWNILQQIEGKSNK